MGYPRFFFGKSGSCVPVLALCILFMGLSNTFVQAATCTATADEPNDPDDQRYLKAFGPSVGAAAHLPAFWIFFAVWMAMGPIFIGRPPCRCDTHR